MKHIQTLRDKDNLSFNFQFHITLHGVVPAPCEWYVCVCQYLYCTANCNYNFGCCCCGMNEHKLIDRKAN